MGTKIVPKGMGPNKTKVPQVDSPLKSTEACPCRITLQDWLGLWTSFATPTVSTLSGSVSVKPIPGDVSDVLGKY